MNGVAADGPEFPASIGLIQPVEELGKIVRREAGQIEFSAIGLTGKTSVSRVLVDEKHIASVTENRKKRQDPKTIPDSLSGVITAVDVAEGRFKIRLPDKTTVRGTFEKLIQEQMIHALNSNATIDGVVEYINGRPNHIRAFCFDESSM